MPSADQPSAEQVNAALGEAIQRTVTELEHSIVTRWVAVVESVDTDGKRGVWMAAPDDAKTWDSLGFLLYGIIQEIAATTVEYIRSDE